MKSPSRVQPALMTRSAGCGPVDTPGRLVQPPVVAGASGAVGAARATGAAGAAGLTGVVLIGRSSLRLASATAQPSAEQRRQDDRDDDRGGGQRAEQNLARAARRDIDDLPGDRHRTAASGAGR